MIDDERTDAVFPRNVTSIGNPHFSSSAQLSYEESSGYEGSCDRSLHTAEQNQSINATNTENYSISFITTNNVLGHKRNFWQRFSHFEKILFFAILVLGIIIFVLAFILLIQPSPMLQVHLTNENCKQNDWFWLIDN